MWALDSAPGRHYKWSAVPKRLALGLALLALALSLTACGVRSAAAPVTGAATKSGQTDGARVALDVTVGTHTITGTGFLSHERSALTLDLSKALAAAGLPAVGGTVDARLIDDGGSPDLYLRSDAANGLLPEGKSWVKIDLGAAAKAAGVDLSGLQAATIPSPLELLALLQLGGFTPAGTETIDGVATMRHKATIDLAQAAMLVGAPAEAAKRLKAAGVSTALPVEVWIGGDGLLRRVTATYASDVAGKSVPFAVTVNLSDYGATVNVEPPAESDVYDASGLLTGLLARSAALHP